MVKLRSIFYTTILLIITISIASASSYYIDTKGSDSNIGSTASPFKSIQKALDIVKPGDTININDGEYFQDFKSKIDGTSSNPITIKGNKNTILRGSGNSNKIGEINHDYYHLEGFTIDGLSGDPNNKYSYRDKLLYIQGKEIKKGVEGLKVKNMNFKNSGGEALRLRYFSKNSEISYSKFENIGVYDFKFNEGGKNGEAIYLGTSSNQWADGKNPTSDPDESTNNWIHHNYFNTNGNECVDVKEGSRDNVIEYNECTGQKDPNSAGLDSRSDENIFRYNKVYGNKGAGVRLGGHNIDGHQYGINNEVYLNEIYNNENGAIKFEAMPQKKICGNNMYNNGKDFTGTYSNDFTISNCDSIITPPIEEPSPINPPINPEVNNNTSDILVQASSNDGNIPQNTLDKSLETRWSAKGNNEWILYDLKSPKFIKSTEIAFYKGYTRKQYFEIKISEDKKNWKKVYDGKSSGKTSDFQSFSIDKKARYIKIIGHGNSLNDWNSITEFKISS